MFKWVRITINGFDQMLEGKVKSVFIFVCLVFFKTRAKEKGKLSARLEDYIYDIVVV